MVTEKDKIRARNATRYLTKPKRCSRCGEKSKRIEGHHEDYSKPHEVTWLCVSCHVQVDPKRGGSESGGRPIGTAVGELNPRAKITEKQVKTIRELYKPGALTLKQIAQTFGLSIAAVYRIVKRQSWSHVE